MATNRSTHGWPQHIEQGNGGSNCGSRDSNRNNNTGGLSRGGGRGIQRPRARQANQWQARSSSRGSIIYSNITRGSSVRGGVARGGTGSALMGFGRGPGGRLSRRQRQGMEMILGPDWELAIEAAVGVLARTARVEQTLGDSTSVSNPQNIKQEEGEKQEGGGKEQENEQQQQQEGQVNEEGQADKQTSWW